MLNFPSSTIFGKKVPKESFYNKMDIGTKIKRSFVNDIEQIIWNNKLSSKTINVGVGKRITEIEVLHIKLKKKKCNYSVFDFIDRNLPHYTVFVLNYNGENQLLINFKEPSENKKGKFKVMESYKTDWTTDSKINLTIDGLDMDSVYEGFVKQIAGKEILPSNEPDIKKSIEVSQSIDKIQKQITTLENKKRKEKQFNLQLKYSNKIKELEKQLSELL
jgi:hypothetical protein